MKGFKDFLKNESNRVREVLSNPEKYRSDFIRLAKSAVEVSNEYRRQRFSYLSPEGKPYLDKLKQINKEFSSKFMGTKQFRTNLYDNTEYEYNLITYFDEIEKDADKFYDKWIGKRK